MVRADGSAVDDPGRRPSSTPTPRQVDGYDEAVSAGLTPARPMTAPSIAGRPTARRALVVLAATIGLAVLAAIACLVSLPGGRITGWGAAVYVVVLVVGYVAVRASLHRFRGVLLDELQAGYVTTTFTQGLFWMPGRGSGRRTWGDDVVGWRWDGLWVLDSHGDVVSAPDRAADPPGLYPSPHRPGELELWTGHRWTGVFPTT